MALVSLHTPVTLNQRVEGSSPSTPTNNLKRLSDNSESQKIPCAHVMQTAELF
jgi:hypothetical protein